MSPYFSYDIIREGGAIMAVTILRKTGFFGSWGKLSLMVKEEEITSISEGQTVTFDLPSYPAFLRVKGDSSTPILVSDHQKYILCVHPPFLWAQAMAFTILFLSLFTPWLLLKIGIYLLFLILSLLIHFLLPHYCFKPLIGPKIDIKEFC